MEELLGRESDQSKYGRDPCVYSWQKGDGDRRRRKHWIRTLSSDRIVSTETVDCVLIFMKNNAYDIQQELKKKYPDLDLVVLVGSIRDSRRINAVFETYRPEVVYHAAAHKHVPLMEDSPCESIKNNAIGTYKTAYAAMMNGCQRFVLISTDKAVNPTNIMGASKRLCEMIIQSFDRMIKEGTPEKLPILYAHADDEDGAIGEKTISLFRKDIKTEFVAVRFGKCTWK